MSTQDERPVWSIHPAMNETQFKRTLGVLETANLADEWPISTRVLGKDGFIDVTVFLDDGLVSVSSAKLRDGAPEQRVWINPHRFGKYTLLGFLSVDDAAVLGSALYYAERIAEALKADLETLVL